MVLNYLSEAPRCCCMDEIIVSEIILDQLSNQSSRLTSMIDHERHRTREIVHKDSKLALFIRQYRP